MIYKLPLIGHLLGIIAAISMAIPFWICWTYCDIGADFFYWLPVVFLRPTFWQCVGFFIVVSCLKTLVPSFFVGGDNKCECDKK